MNSVLTFESIRDIATSLSDSCDVPFVNEGVVNAASLSAKSSVILNLGLQVLNLHV